MAKNTFKNAKFDSNGKQLPEQIGKGFCKEHYQKVKEARIKKDDYIRFRCTSQEKIEFILSCGGEDFSKVARSLIIAYSKGQLKIK